MERLASGDWLGWPRVRTIACAAAAYGMLLLAVLFVTANGTVDAQGRPLGTDFSVFWNAGAMAKSGQASAAWDPSQLNAAAQRFHASSAIPDSAWPYPPPFLLVARALAALPYTWALLAWSALGLFLAWQLLRRVLPDRRTALVAMTAPVIPLVLAHGQNPLLTAALLGGGLLVLERKPFVAGLLFGALVYKPQLALLLGPLLLFRRDWQAIAGAAASSSLLIAATLLLWGVEPWRAFLDSLPIARGFMENGAVGFHKSASLFALVRPWGAPIWAAYTIQAFGLAAALWMSWSLRRASKNLLGAGVCAAAALSTPYLLDYELAIIGLGGAFLYAEARRTGFHSWEKTALAFLWIAPAFSRLTGEWLLLPLGPFCTVALAVLTVRRALEHRHAAVDVQRLAGDVAGFPAGEVDHRRADILA